MSFQYWKPYIPVAKLRDQASRKAAKLKKNGRKLSPVAIEGRSIAKTFWGHAWCRHIESFSDYETRLPRGRAYVRNGAVLDLQITKGVIAALVMGSSCYELNFTIKPLDPLRWAEIKRQCAGRIDSLVELLQGRFSDAVMRVITDGESGLFPSLQEIQKTCSCPDWADLCKHLAAALYGIGTRLDQEPELLFLLRGVDPSELLERTSAEVIHAGSSSLNSEDLADVFGIEIAPVELKTQAKDAVLHISAKKASAVRVETGIPPIKRRLKKPSKLKRDPDDASRSDPGIAPAVLTKKRRKKTFLKKKSSSPKKASPIF